MRVASLSSRSRRWILSFGAAGTMAAAMLFSAVPAHAITDGACCYDPDGDCVVSDAKTCSIQGGTYQGDFSTCSPNPCVAQTTTTIPQTTTTTIPAPVCGNETIEPGEQCDDGGIANGDGCNSDCQFEYCGDATTNNNGAEQCDDGNTDSGDGCNAVCLDEFCGDDSVNDNGVEECDDGNTNNGDGCNAACLNEFCGDGGVNDCPILLGFDARILISCPEECDDGDTISGDGCSANCKIEFCGDGTVNNCLGPRIACAEQCDDGNTSDGDGCNTNCIDEFCGDGTVNDDGAETCDDGNTDNSDSCVSCQGATCGDGYILYSDNVPLEACDDGNTEAGDGCDSSCVDEFCGDEIVNDNGAEQCDDGDTDDSDSCLSNCQDATCGDDILNVSDGKAIEQCDDGGTENGDGCNEFCQLENGACCYGSACTDDVSEADCGIEFGGSFGGPGSQCSDAGVCVNCSDAILQFGEQCDDGDTETGDGCDGGCQEEECWTCTEGVNKGQVVSGPSVCEPDDGATCDDGDECTLDDICDGGACGGSPPIIPAACEWVMIAGSADGKAQARARGSADIVGDTCGNRTRIGDASIVVGDAVATKATGKASEWGSNVEVAGDIVTGGGSITGKPRDTLLPGLNTDSVPGGSSQTQSGDPSSELDATGMHARLADCQDAIDSLPASAALVTGLDDTDDMGKVQLPLNSSLQIEATGPLNVVDFSKLIVGTNSTITLDGNGIPDVVFVLRVEKKIYLKLGTKIVLTGGATPARVILYGGSLCKFGQKVEGYGTVFCPNGKLKLDQLSSWEGVLISGKKRVDVRHASELDHAPLQIGVP